MEKMTGKRSETSDPPSCNGPSSDMVNTPQDLSAHTTSPRALKRAKTASPQHSNQHLQNQNKLHDQQAPATDNMDVDQGSSISEPLAAAGVSSKPTVDAVENAPGQVPLGERAKDKETNEMQTREPAVDEPQDDATTADESTGLVASSAESASASASNSTTSSPLALLGDSPELASMEEVFFNSLFPMLTEETRVFSEWVSDQIGQNWRVIWYPKGQQINDECVSVGIEMIVKETPRATGDVSRALDTCSDEPFSRVMDIEIVVARRNQPEATFLRSRHVHEFTTDDNRFAISKFLPRTILLDPKSKFMSDDGCVHLQVHLRPHGKNGPSTVESAGSDSIAPTANNTLNATTLDPLVTDGDMDADGDAEGADGDVGSIITPTASSVTDQFLGYDSKEETSMVGLKNQGATCYMNSLLQTLFHLRAFRQMVYDTPTDQEDTNDSVSLALQRVFYRLQTQSKAVSTKELTRSFGWSQIDSFMQHDVQELYRILCDRLEEKMKGTKVDNAIKKLFEGKVRSFVQCVNVDFQSFRDESFYDLQLDVKGCRDIYQSFRKYVEIEMLQGDNQYEAEGYGKQDARKGVRFLKFPPVLNIQLKRFEYDPMRDGMVKIHDRFEFPTKLVLNEFFQDESESSEKVDANGSNGHGSSTTKAPSYVYHLHSVLVHSGDVHGGHYYVYIRPGPQVAGNTNWFKFDDDQISRVDEQIAVEGSYGTLIPSNQSHIPGANSSPMYTSMCSPLACAGQNPVNGDPPHEDRPHDDMNGHHDITSPELGPSKSSPSNSLLMPLGKSFSSAYMLVYIRDGINDISSIEDAPATTATTINCNYEAPEKDDNADVPIPQSLLDRFHEEEKATARRKRLQQTEHLFMVVRIASDWSITKLKKITKSIDFSSFSNNMCLRVRIRRAATIRQLYQRIYKRTGIPLDRQRLWKVITRENRTHRPDTPLNDDSLDCPVELLFDEDSSSKSPVRLYLQILHPPSSSPCGAISKCRLNRFFLHEFTAPDKEEANDHTTSENTPNAADPGEEDEMEEDPARHIDDTEQKNLQVIIPPMERTEILLFVKHYDVKKPLKERLEYKGNLLISSRCTGAELAKYLHEALVIPFTKEMMLYEEVHPLSVSDVEMDSTLDALGLQNGDIICYQFTDDAIDAFTMAEEVADSMGDRDEDEATADLIESMEKYPDVPSYFRYLLDRCEVTFQPWNVQGGPTIVVNLLYSNTYWEIINAVSQELGDTIPDKWHLRLYQHSTLTGTAKRSPLRHGKYANDGTTTLEDFLTEYSERTSTMYYEILEDSIISIEAKKQVLVYFSAYDDVFVDTNAPKLPRRVELLLKPSATVGDLMALVRTMFQLDEEAIFRVCEVVCGGTLITGILGEGATLEPYWSCQANHYPNGDAIKQLFIECISPEEQQVLRLALAQDQQTDSKTHLIAVNHFSYHPNTFLWIHTHGIPFVVHFDERETTAQVLERMRQRIGASAESFCRWDLAFVKDGKAASVREVFEDEDWLASPMQQVFEKGLGSRLAELDSEEFQSLVTFGLEHPNTMPITPKYSRRQEQGIKIRQS